MDNKLILQKLCDATTNLQKTDAAVLVKQVEHEEYDTENISVVVDSGGSIAMFLDAFMSTDR
jgi:hypothetical protein